jgi:hypothetical protein
LATAAAVVAAVLALWAWGKAADARAAAGRAEAIASRAERAAAQIRRLAPPALVGDAGRAVGELADAALAAAGAGPRALRGRSVRPLGPVGETGLVKAQARLEFAGLTQRQVGAVLAALEGGGVPTRVDAAALTPAATGADADAWDLAVDLSWLQRPAGGL